MMTRKQTMMMAAATLLLGGGLLAGVASQSKPKPFAARPAAETKSVAVVVPAGTLVRVRINQAVGSGINRPGDHFEATLEGPLVADGRTLAPGGATVRGLVREARPSGRLKGRAELILTLDSLEAHGQRIALGTDSKRWESGAHQRRNLGWLAGGTGTGALIGGLAGGPVGLGVGAGAGAAAGLTGAAVTGRRHVRLPAETLMTFRLERAVTIQPAS